MKRNFSLVYFIEVDKEEQQKYFLESDKIFFERQQKPLYIFLIQT